MSRKKHSHSIPLYLPHVSTKGKKKTFFSVIFCILLGFMLFVYFGKHVKKIEPIKSTAEEVIYTGPIYHIFFHSLVLYPELAFHGPGNQTFKDYLVTQSEFKKILPELYKNNFVLIDIHSLYRVEKDGSVVSLKPLVPKGKKPLVISLDDLSYYRNQEGKGMARKLVLDGQGNVATEVVTPQGKTIVTRDGDVVPILDDFIKEFPDFSPHGVKGVIALTGYDGILGYRTEARDGISLARLTEINGVKKIIKKLKETGWSFASHSYTHETSFIYAHTSLDALKDDTERWKAEVAPLVGDTNIFIGPFGQVFTEGDPRRNYLISEGFKMLCGVGMDIYLHNFGDHVVMTRADIDGIRLSGTPWLLTPYFDPKVVIDDARK